MLAATGCPDDPPAGPCSGQGDPSVIVSRRDDAAPPLTDGDDLDVFLPPQGGTFTELDVVIVGLASDDIDSLRIAIRRRDDATVLADQSYRGNPLPYQCLPDDSLLLQNVPVGFEEWVILEELEGVEIELAVLVASGQDVVRFDADLVLVVTPF
jgi:hypothetical protein